MSSRREEILRATQEASHIARRFPTGNRTSFDIFGALGALGIPVMFRPLKGLWGAVITLDGNLHGILVTTQLPLSVQRFTLAHELGHVLLGHKLIFDKEIGFSGRYEAPVRSHDELAADTFASELLAQRPLMLAAARRHHWTKDALRRPQNIYQLALRLGISYQAACWALVSNDVASREIAGDLARQEVKSLKQQLLPSQHETDPWSDAWFLTEGDSGTHIEGSLNDTFVVRLRDKSSAGFLWNLVDAGSAAKVIDDSYDLAQAYGAEVSRTIVLQFDESGHHRLLFEQVRPWNEQELAQIEITIDNHGKEVGGLPRRAREIALARAS